MKVSLSSLACALVLTLAAIGCGAAQGPAAPAAAPPVLFRAAPGAPTFPPSTRLFILRIGGPNAPTAPREPHVKIGDIVVRSSDAPGVSEKKMLDALAATARKRGATQMIVTHCNAATECGAGLFVLMDEIEPGLRARVTASGPPSPAAAPGNAATGALIANNKALGAALLGIWTPDASGEIPASAHTVLERELLRSYLYVNAAKASPPMHEGNLIVYTDQAGLREVDGPGSKPLRGTPAEIFQMALNLKVGIYLHYEAEGDDETSVFTNFDQDELRALLARTKTP